jgi:hypothetical protein
MLSINIPAVMGHHTQSLADNERQVTQYGPEWTEHVQKGGAVRNGNILIGSVQ